MAYVSPASKAMPYLSQIGNVPSGVLPYYQPYMDAGNTGLQGLQGVSQTLRNPVTAYNQVASTYQESPAAQNQIAQTTRSMDNSAAAGGFAGSPYNQGMVGNAANNIVAKDQRDYMNQVFQLYRLGELSDEQLAQLGLNSTDKYGNIYNQDQTAMLNSQASAAYADQAERNQNAAQHRNNMWKMIGAGVGGLADVISVI